jgi:Phage tail assembly chaperone proteins, E, or 41 or 14
MNKPSRREGFVDDAEPIDAAPTKEEVVAAIDNEPGLLSETWPVKVQLRHKPLRVPGGELLRELTFREPTGGDINRYGNPCHVDQYGEVQIVERKMTTMIAVLSGVLQPFIEGMDPRDWNSCAYRLRGFFLPDPASW